MNQMRYANFPTLLNTGANSIGVKRTYFGQGVLSGMWKITILTKDGFAGLNKLNDAAQELELDTRKAVNKVLQENTITNPQDDEYLNEVRNYVRSEVSGMFHR